MQENNRNEREQNDNTLIIEGRNAVLEAFPFRQADR